MAQNEKPEVCTPEAVVKQAGQGHDVSAKFNAECSPAERREFFQTLQQKGTPTESQLSGTHAAAMLDGFKVNYDSTARKLDSVETAAGKPLKTESKNSGERQVEKKAVPPADTGRPGVDDSYTRGMRSSLRDHERPTADSIGKKILNGENVSSDINALGRDAKVRIMAEVKGKLAEKPGTTVDVSQGSDADSTRYVTMKTADGKSVLFSESRMGIPQDIQMNAGSLKNRLFNGGSVADKFFGGASDLYDKDGEAGARSAAKDSGPTWVDKLKGPPIDTTKGPLGRYLNQQPMEPGDEAALKKLKDQGILKDVVERKRD